MFLLPNVVICDSKPPDFWRIPLPHFDRRQSNDAKKRFLSTPAKLLSTAAHRDVEVLNEEQLVEQFNRLIVAESAKDASLATAFSTVSQKGSVYRSSSSDCAVCHVAAIEIPPVFSNSWLIEKAYDMNSNLVTPFSGPFLNIDVNWRQLNNECFVNNYECGHHSTFIPISLSFR